MMRFMNIYCLLLLLAIVFLGSSSASVGQPRAPPPVAEYLRQRGQQTQVGASAGAARSSVGERRNAARPPPVMLRPDTGQWALPLAHNAHSQMGRLEGDRLTNSVVYNVGATGKGMVAMRDDDLQACFIHSVIVPFVMPPEQRRFYTHSLSGMLLDTTARDRTEFRAFVGGTIYDLCAHLRVYWLDNDLLSRFLHMLDDGAHDDHSDDHPEVVEIGEGRPRLMIQEDEDYEVRTPPPVSLYHVLRSQQDLSRFRNPDADSRPRTPPPVMQYRHA